MQVKISEIVINPRQRKELTEEDIDERAASMKKFGQLQNIVLNETDDGTLELVAGFTRIMAAMQLGWEEIDAKLQEDLSDVEKKEMELEENIQRKQLEWHEEANAIAEIHAMRQAADPEWSMSKTAQMVGKSKATVSRSVDLAEALEEDPDLKTENTLRGALSKRDTTKKIEKRKKEIERKKAGKAPSINAVIIPGDARDLIKKEADESFDAIITNFPFGVDFELKGGEEVYYDEEQYITHLVQEIVRECFRVLKEDSWMVAWFDIRKITYNSFQKDLYKQVIGSKKIDNQILFDSMGLTFWMEQAGFRYVTVVPAIWAKPNKTQGIIGDPRKGMIVAYEAMVFASKGDAVLLKQGRNDLFVYDTLNPSERDFEMQMPVELCSEIVSMVTLGGGRVLDPFAGVGSIGEGCLDNQCEFRGYELDKERAMLGNTRLAEHIFASTEEEGD